MATYRFRRTGEDKDAPIELANDVAAWAGALPNRWTWHGRHRAIALLGALQQRLELVLSPSTLLELPNFFVLMIESRTWGYFTPTLRGFGTSASPSPPRLDADENGNRIAWW